MNARNYRRSAGTSTLEFALVLPLLMLMLIGIVQYSFYFYVSESMQTLTAYAARSAAIQAQGPPGQSITLVTGTHDCTTGTLCTLTPALDPTKVSFNVQFTAPTAGSDPASNGVAKVTVTATYPYSIPFLPISTQISVTSQASYYASGYFTPPS